MPKISFILPVYNVRPYLSRTAESLKQQTMPDFEAIFVNDGSTDGSEALLQTLAASDSRFRVLNQENQGVAAARNTALDAALGAYLFFLDPDDWIEPETAQTLLLTAEEADADMVMFGRFHDDYSESSRCIRTDIVLPPLTGTFRNHPFQTHFESLASAWFVTNKLVRRTFVEENQIRFSARSIGEDALFSIALMRHQPSCLVMLDRPLYHYTEDRRGSLSHSFRPELLSDGFALSQALRDTVTEWGLLQSPPHRKKLMYCTVRDLQMAIRNLGYSPLPWKERRKHLLKWMQDAWIRQCVAETPVKSQSSRNDRLKLWLLQHRLYSATIALAAGHRVWTERKGDGREHQTHEA